MKPWFRAGYPDRRNPKHPVQRAGLWWIRVGPYVLGMTSRWDKSGAP